MTSNRRTFISQLGRGAAGFSLVTLLPGCRTAQPEASGEMLARSKPAAEGVSPSGILAFLDAAAHEGHEMHSFMLVRHGKVVAEGWWAPYGPEFNHTMYSMSKSFTSTAAGFAAAEGKLSVEDRVVSFFPGELPDEVSEHLAALRIKDLLTMSVGNEKEPTLAMVKEENWVKTFLAAPIVHKPGTRFQYNSGATYMVSAIVQKVTGMSVLDYLKPRLFDPLEIEGMQWEMCPRGICVGGWGLSIRTEGLAKFGQLYLQKGVWRGRRILPAQWIDEATTAHIQQPRPEKPGRPNDRNDWVQGYGYQFWRSTHGAYRGDGAFGQYTIVMPEQDAVIAITSETGNMQGQLDLVWEHLLPAMSDRPVRAERAVEERLAQRLASLALGLPSGYPTSSYGPVISKLAYQLEANPLGLERASFVFGPQNCRVTLEAGEAKYPIECGIGRWERGSTALPGTPPRLISGGAPKAGTLSKVAATGSWKDDRTFEMMMRYYETPHHDRVTCRFESDRVEIAFMNSIAGRSASPKDGRPVLKGQWLTKT